MRHKEGVASDIPKDSSLAKASEPQGILPLWGDGEKGKWGEGGSGELEVVEKCIQTGGGGSTLRFCRLALPPGTEVGDVAAHMRGVNVGSFAMNWH